MKPSELREAIRQHWNQSMSGNLSIDSATDAILDAVIASLPEKNLSRGIAPLLSQRLLGYNDALTDVRELLQLAKSTSKENR